MSDDDELPGIQDIVAHLRTRASQLDPSSGEWRFRVRGPDARDRLIAIAHQRERDGDGWIFVRAACGETLASTPPQDPERELDLRGLVVYVMSGEHQAMIPFETIESLADFDRALDQILATFT